MKKVLERSKRLTSRLEMLASRLELETKVKRRVAPSRGLLRDYEPSCGPSFQAPLRWKCLNESETSDNMDFQPLVMFLNYYTECYA